MSVVIDADAHVIEGPAFHAALAERWPDRIGREEFAFRIEGRMYPHSTGPGAGCPPQAGLLAGKSIQPFSVEGVLADADREGIDRMVLFPSLGLGASGLQDPSFAGEFCRLYNEWLADYCKEGGGRLLGVAIVPLRDVDTSSELLRHARELGHVATMIPPALDRRNLDHPDLDRFYAAAAELDMPLGVHGAPGVHLPKIGVDRFTNYIQVHCVSFPFDAMLATTALVSGGVLERHPRLRVAILESGVTWMPYFLDRLHEHYEKRGSWIENGWKREPREYLERGQLYVSCEPGESLLGAVVDQLGPDFILYASDYPHWDSDFPASAQTLRERDDLSEGVRAKILGENAQRFFGLG